MPNALLYSMVSVVVPSLKAKENLDTGVTVVISWRLSFVLADNGASDDDGYRIFLW
jgi:hypothetical protein